MAPKGNCFVNWIPREMEKKNANEFANKKMSSKGNRDCDGDGQPDHIAEKWDDDKKSIWTEYLPSGTLKCRDDHI
jgi:hypothetical protein